MFQRFAHRVNSVSRASPISVFSASYRFDLHKTFRVDFIHRGLGTKPRKGDSVTIHYTGRNSIDSKIFDSTYVRGQPFTFRLGFDQVIKGVDEGVAQMDVGSKAVITCPPEWAYGATGVPGFIPGDATIHFEVELIQVNGKRD